jgi:hypothetical protein
MRIENLAVCDVVNRDSLYEYPTASGRNIHEFTLVSSGNNPGDNHLAFFGDDVFNRET